MKLLMEYMYKGRISVRQADLDNILKTASSLQIHGLTNAEPPETDVAPGGGAGGVAGDRWGQVETGSSHSGTSGESSSREAGKRGAGGRKSSKPKKLKLNGETTPRYPTVPSPRFPAAALEQADPVITPLLSSASDQVKQALLLWF